MRSCRVMHAVVCVSVLGAGSIAADYVNFESSHVHPIDLTPSGARLLAVNTPDALLEVFDVGPGGELLPRAAIPVGLEPVTVAARTESEAWVVNHLSDTISIVDLESGTTVRTLPVGDEPTDVVFANGRAFVAVSQEDAVKVFNLADLAAPPRRLDIFSSDVRALAVSRDGTKVFAVALHSGNQTTVVNANVIHNGNNPGLDATRLGALGLNTIACNGAPPPYPPLPDGLQRDPALPDPPAGGTPPVGLIVRWDRGANAWRDEAGSDWTHCLPFRLPDHDLFIIDTTGLAVTSVDHLGTSLFEVSVNPANGKVYVPHTEARNQVRFEHALGVRGHMVDNRMAIVDPAAGNAVTLVDLNAHIDRGSDPATNLLERVASISQPGMMAWEADGSHAWLTAIGSRKLFRLDGSCLSGGCIFGTTRGLPDAVEVGEGPTGVVLHEAGGRAYVLNRFSNSIALVDLATLTRVGEVPLHDPSPPVVRQGRRLLYDGIETSGHGDAACASCHISGDRDELAWDLGDPTGAFTPYGTPGDNVRFVVPNPVNQQLVECDPVAVAGCASHDGFDPQKGPMTTQTLRGMLEPLHWRGDRATMNAFNKAFVGLMGSADIGPINGEPAGLTADRMELFRQFALGIVFGPNPHRRLDDTLPNAPVTIPSARLTGNPANGETLFLTRLSDANAVTCVSCHQLPFGAAGGKLGGVEPGDPSAARTALFQGNADGSPHSDLEIPHTRNMYEKTGPRFGSHTNAADPPADQKSGFGFTHDGAIPDMATFLSAGVFSLTAAEARDIATFMMHFPTGTRPAVGAHVTVPQGLPPTGTPAQEQVVADLVRLGNRADTARHCELVASAVSGGRPRTWYLDGGIGSGGLWTTDVEGELPITTTDLRRDAGGPVAFLCGTVGSGVRLGADRDLDQHFNGTDCADGDAATFGRAGEVANLAAAGAAPLHLSWEDQSAATGPGVRYDVVGGLLSRLRADGLAASTSCIAGGLVPASYDDGRADPPPGEGLFYLTRAINTCGSGGFGPGRETIESLVCGGGP